MNASMKPVVFFDHQKDSQRVGTKSPPVEQPDLFTARKSCPPVDKPYVLSLPSFRRALRYSLSLADLDPKQVFEPLGMDKATWSRIENGAQAFPPDLLNQLAEITGNDAPLIWLAHSRGYELRPLKSELQERLDAAEARAADLEHRLGVITEFVKQTRP